MAVLAAAVLLLPSPAPAQVVTVTPGDTIVTEMAAGRIVAIAPNGQLREVATGLTAPRGVAVMADGSILVAETGQNRIVGIGGRFGTGPPQVVASVPFPEGITVSSTGEVFATALQAGEMGRIDIDAGTFNPIARGLDGPGDVVVRGLAMFVTESAPGGRVVASVGADGQTAEFTDGFERPVGLAFGPGSTLFVADAEADRIVRVDAQGNTTTFAEVDDPAHLAIEPWVAVEGEPFTLAVTSAEGVVRFDQDGARVSAIPVTGAAGIATVPGTGPNGTAGPSVPTTQLPTTTAPVPTTESTPTESAPATTRPPRTTTTISEEEGAPSSTSGGILLASIVIIGLIVVGGIVFAIVQRPKSGNRSGFEERPLDTNTVALAFGTCAAEEVELAEAEGALTSLEVQSEAAEKRLAAATEAVTEARARLVEARRAARSDSAASSAPGVVVAAPPEPTPEPEPDPEPEQDATPTPSSTGLKLDDLELRTAAGKAALNAFLTREIEADELEEMWRALGEDRAIEVVRSARRRDADAAAESESTDATAAPDGDPADPADPGGEATGADVAAGADADGEPEDLWAEPTEDPVDLDLDEETLAANALAEAEEDVTHAQAEIERLHERQAAARGRIAAAQRALDECQERHRADLEAEAAANAQAAVAAASSRLSPAPPAPPGAPADGGDAGGTDDDPPAEPSAASSGTAGDPQSGTGDGGDPADPGSDGGSGDPAPPTDPADPPAPSVATVLPTIPERPPLTPDAATVASLRRPSPPADAPDPDADGLTADPAPGAARREGLDRGFFDDDDDEDEDAGAGGRGGASTFPASPASTDDDDAVGDAQGDAQGDADPGPGHVSDPGASPAVEPTAEAPAAGPGADERAGADVDDAAEADPPAAGPGRTAAPADPVTPPAPDASIEPDPPHPAGPERPASSTPASSTPASSTGAPTGVSAAGPAAEPAHRSDAADPDPMGPLPSPAKDPGTGDQSLSDVLFRDPADQAPGSEPTGGRIDDLVFAWPASGFQPLPTAVEPSSPDAGPAEPADAEPARGADPAGDDDGPPRPDLKFL